MKILGVSARSLTVGITSLLILDLIALAAFAVHRTTVTTTTTRPAASAATTAPGGAVTPLAPPAIAIAVAPPGSIDTDTDAPSPSPTTKAGGGSAPSSAGPSTGDLPSIKPAAIGKCPVKIATPDQLGLIRREVPQIDAVHPRADGGGQRFDFDGAAHGRPPAAAVPARTASLRPGRRGSHEERRRRPQ